MKKRFDSMWRVIVTLLLIAAVVPAVALSGAVGAAGLDPQEPPDSYIDPIPDYVNADYIGTAPANTWITGTSICAESREVDEVQIQIKRHSDGKCWDEGGGGGWDLPCEWNDATLGLNWNEYQWDWQYDDANAPDSAQFQSGLSYTVTARAFDDDGKMEPEASWPSDTFIYDDKDTDVSFKTVFPGTIYDDLDEIIGTASDDDGEVDQVRVRITMDPLGTPMHWNGLWWQPDPFSVWLPTDGTLDWEISYDTDPALPEWYNGVNYVIDCQASDKADNRDTNEEGPLTFLFRKTVSATSTKPGLYVDPLPEYANAMTEVSGTAKAKAGQNIAELKICIYDDTDDVWWNDDDDKWDTSDPPTKETSAGWAKCPELVTDAVGTLTYMPVYGQWDWSFDLTAFGPSASTPPGISGEWADGHKYRIQTYTEDDSATPNKRTSSYEYFTYDNVDPASVIDAFDVIVYNHWGSLTGVAEDGKGGEIGMVVVLIMMDLPPLNPPPAPAGVEDRYWNGAGWGAVQWGLAGGNWWDWVFAEPESGKKFDEVQEEWEVTSSTAHELPPLKNGETYHLYVHALDRAGNEETTAEKRFTFKYDMSGVEHPTPTPEAPGGTPEPTAEPTGPGPAPTSPEPSATETPEPTAEPTAGPTSTPEATATPVSPTATPTATSTAGEGGMEWVWWHYLLIGLAAALFIALIILIMVKPGGGGGEAEAGEEAAEEEEL